jgi:hypothetical protein
MAGCKAACRVAQRPGLMWHHSGTFVCWVQVVASGVVDKYIGESARVIREMFGWVACGAAGSWAGGT